MYTYIYNYIYIYARHSGPYAIVFKCEKKRTKDENRMKNLTFRTENILRAKQ